MTQPGELPKVVKVGPRTFAAVIHAYLASAKFAALGSSAQYSYRHHLKIAGHPDTLGAIDVAVIRPALVQQFLDGYADKPGAQVNARKAIKAVERWALVRDLLPYPISIGTEVIAPADDSGHRPWRDDQVALAEHHARADVARIVVLAANTGQRGSDLCRMRWSDIERVQGRPGINVVQRKTGFKLWIPFTEPLQAAMEGWDRRPGMILLRTSGEPWGNRKQLSMAWERERDRNPHLAPCTGLVLHGLRATAVVRLRRAGAPATLISDMVGLSVPMVERYCRLSNQQDNAMAAVHFLDRTAAERLGHSKIERHTKTGG